MVLVVQSSVRNLQPARAWRPRFP